MWTYVARRLLIMIPTLFGITLIAFIIMQLAPGDPLMNQLGQVGATGSSSQTREQYLVQKRDLKLDKPLILNFRYFISYALRVQHAAHYRSMTVDEIQKELPALAENPERFKFVRSLKIPGFEERLNDPKHHARLAIAIDGLTMIFCENLGKHGVPPAVEILRSPADAKLKTGAIRALSSMVLDPYVYTYSREPADDETPRVVATWKTWWERAKSGLPAPSAQRREEVRRRISELAAKTSRAEIFEAMGSGFSRDDAPIFAETLLGDSPLREKHISALGLNLYVGKPLKVNIPLGAPAPQVEEVAQNWIAHTEARRDEYEPGLLSRFAYIVTDTQYAHMVWRLITFDFGRSAIGTRDPVSKKIWSAILVTAPLMLLAEAMIYFLAVPLGIFAAVRRGKKTDRAITLGLFLLYSVPNFVAGMLFLVFFCYGTFLKIFPMTGLHSEGAQYYGSFSYVLDYAWHLILPVTCLALFSMAGLAMYSRTSMLEIINQDYIRTARAKGLPNRLVVFKHALRNALIPIITLFATFIPAMLGGSVIIEVLFTIPGMGRLSFESIEAKDFPTLMALIYIDAILVMISMLISDLLYAFADPRISFEARSGAA